ncbi:MAG: CPBP family glutamic-type intramembrane protease [Pseudomonadota bacterium]|nr:CPBP family glutamic-type intramembrane protease [Pseudomonadota bacterium]
MLDLAISIAAWTAILTAIAVAVALKRRGGVKWGWYAAACLIFAGYAFALIHGGEYVPVKQLFPDYQLQWNWAGKIASIGYTLLMVALLAVVSRKTGPAAVGFTLRQNAGSVVPALIVMALLVGLSVGAELIARDGTDTGLERLLYQATMPGFDEEPMMRGVALVLMNEAFGRNWRVLGAEMGWGGLLLTLLFGLIHGLFYQDGAFAFNGVAVAITGVIGFGLLYIRERTGSLLLPIVAHNVVNVSNSFF